MKDQDPRALAVVGIDASTDAILSCNEPGSDLLLASLPMLIGGFTLDEYPRLVDSDTMHWNNHAEVFNKESLIPEECYAMIGDDTGVLVHGEGLYHLTYAAQDRCGSQLKVLLKKFPNVIGRCAEIRDLPCKMPDFTDISKKLKNRSRHYKHAYQFLEEMQAIVQRYHHLSLTLLSQAENQPTAQVQNIMNEYNKMQNVMDNLFEPGVLERKDGGYVILHDSDVEACCTQKDRKMPGSDEREFFVGPIRNLAYHSLPSASNRTVSMDSLVVKMQGVTPSTSIGDLVMCYKVVADMVTKNITHLKYADNLFGFNTLVHDAIMMPNLGLKKFYFTLVEHSEVEVVPDIDDLLEFIGGEEEKPVPKPENKKIKKKPKKSRSKNSIPLPPEAQVLRSSSAGTPSQMKKNFHLNLNLDEASEYSPSPEVEDFSLLGAHGTARSSPDLDDIDFSDSFKCLNDAMHAALSNCNEEDLQILDICAEEERKLLEGAEEERERARNEGARSKVSEALRLEKETEERKSARQEKKDAEERQRTKSLNEESKLQEIQRAEKEADDRKKAEQVKAEEEKKRAEKIRADEETMKTQIEREKSKLQEAVLLKVKEAQEKKKEAEEKIRAERAKIKVIEADEKKTKNEFAKIKLMEALELKEKEAEENRKAVQEMIDDKSKEMTSLITAVEQIEDQNHERSKKILKIEGAVKDLEDEKLNIVKECEESNENIAKLERKKKKLGDFIEHYASSKKQQDAQLQKDIESLKALITIPAQMKPEVQPEVGATSATTELLRFITKQIEDMEKEMECPVCLEVAMSPIYKCEDDHLICSHCRMKVKNCPVCRMIYPEGGPKRYRGAERQAEKLEDLYKKQEQENQKLV